MEDKVSRKILEGILKESVISSRLKTGKLWKKYQPSLVQNVQLEHTLDRFGGDVMKLCNELSEIVDIPEKAVVFCLTRNVSDEQ